MELYHRLIQPYQFLAWSFLSVGCMAGLLLLMAHLPGPAATMCRYGVHFDFWHAGFALVLSLLIAWNMVMLWEIAHSTPLKSTTKKPHTGWLAMVGGVLGVFTMFCTVCTLPVLVLFGTSLSLVFLSEYGLWFQGASVVLLLGSLWWGNRYLVRGCVRCRLH